MYRSAEFMAITEMAVDAGPEVLRKYVTQFFKKTEIFGRRCWIAFCTSAGLENIRWREAHKGGGVAPTHNMEVDGFSIQGLSEGASLRDVIKELEKDPERCFSFCAGWNDGCIGSIVDDD